MVRTTVRTMVNPSPRKKRRKVSGSRPKKRRAKAVKRHRPRSKSNPVKRKRANPKPRVKVRTRTITKIKYRTRKAKSSSNPGIVTLGLVNPGGKMKKARKRMKRAGRSNPTRVRTITRYKSRRRRMNPHRRRRSNPSMFGTSVSSSQMLKYVAGGSFGWIATRVVSGLAASFVPASSPLISSAVGFAAAFAVGKGVGMADKNLEFPVMLGGFISAGTSLISSVFPSLGGNLGAFVPSQNVLPYNGIRMARSAAATAAAAAAASSKKGAMRVNPSGVGRAFGGAF